MSDSNTDLELPETPIDYNNKIYCPNEGEDSTLHYLLSGKVWLTQETQESLQDLQRDKYQQDYEDELASNTQVVPYIESIATPEESDDEEPPIVPMDNQPRPNQVLHEDTTYHWQPYVCTMTWGDKDAAKEWAQEHGEKILCSVVQNKQVRPYCFQMVCECSGTYESHWKKGTSYKRKHPKRPTPISRTIKTDCPFKLQFWQDHEKRFFLKSVICGRHNHEPPETLLSHARASKLKPEELEIVERLWRQGLKPLEILRYLKEANKKNHSGLSTIYNALSRFKEMDACNRDVMQQVMVLAEEKKYTIFFDLKEKTPDGKQKVKHLLLANPDFIKLARCNPQILLIDCTYKTNKYKLPLLNVVGQTSTKSPFTVAFCFLENELEESYVWALKQVKLFYPEDRYPMVILTDKEQALINAIGVVFPKAHHLLCTYHAWNSVQVKCKKIIWPPKEGEKRRIRKLPLHQQKREFEQMEIDFIKNKKIWESFGGDWDTLVFSPTEEEYEIQKAKLLAHWGRYPDVVKYLKEEWLDDAIKVKFVYCFTNQYLHLGNEATSTVESSNHRFKSCLRRPNCNFVTVFKSMDIMFKDDLRRIKTLFEESRNRRITPYLKNPWAPWFSRLWFKVSQWALERIFKELEAYVQGNYTDVCVCGMWKSMGLPCRHMFSKYVDGVIPLEDIHPFWKQLSFHEPAEDGGVPAEFNNTYQYEAIVNFYNRINDGQKSFWLEKVLQFVEPQNNLDIEEPDKGPRKGRKKTTVPRWQERMKRRDPIGVEWLNKEYEDDEDDEELQAVLRESMKRPKTCNMGEGSTSRASNVKGKEPMYPTQDSSKGKSPVIQGEERSSKIVKKKTIRYKRGGHMVNPTIDREGNFVRPHHTIYEDWYEYLPTCIHKYIVSMDDVEGDGNCGYHVVTNQLGPFSGATMDGRNMTQVNYIRQGLLNQLRSHAQHYKNMLLVPEGSSPQQEYIKFQARLQGGIPISNSEFWMRFPVCGHLIADAYRCVVHYFDSKNSWTFTPEFTNYHETLARKRRVSIAFVQDCHFIGLKLSDKCPLPPLAPTTMNKAKGKEWTQNYEVNMHNWPATFMDSGFVNLGDDSAYVNLGDD